MMTTVIKTGQKLRFLPKVLDRLVGKFQTFLGSATLAAVFDANGKLLYGSRTADEFVDHRLELLVNNEVVGSLCVYTPLDSQQLVMAEMLCESLSEIAIEMWRRDQISDELLVRYDELNLVYELGTKFAEGTTKDAIVEFVLQETKRIIKPDAGVVYLLNEQGRLDVASDFGNKVSPDFWGGRMRELAHGALNAYEHAMLFEVDKVICAPLRFNDARLGLLMLVYDSEDKQFRASDVNLLTTLTQSTALFIYAAQLLANLTEEKATLLRTLDELQATRDRLNHAERLSLVGQTVGSLVHDMRKPLSNVMGYAGLLQEPDLTHDERFQFADQIIKYIQVFSDMAQEVLDYTSGDAAVTKTPITVGQFMSFVTDLLMPPGLERSTQLIVDVSSAGDIMINVDAQRFSRVFQNLVNNAMDAIESHGGSKVEIAVESVGRDIRFMITDDGPGVPEKIRETLFQPFVTFGKSNGTGLGLAIVDRMVQSHGGRIHYEQSPNGGARFVFTVPRYA
jgi:signal transduction histidine kinase